ncbi:sialate O-acetylesterase [Paradesertivirga mongoliensis]|uniref:Sialate O-acetylesterase n=1 Tax=Paradesertivirga mongoliensis TaxID=2100740 RepID=A0ABW4ZSN9_9SPHI|nr:sialate O-acetylesterase [Pedobacter mongoliensis]
MKKLLLVLTFSIYSSLVSAGLRLPNFFGDHMVFQRNVPIVIWGWTDSNEAVSVQFAGQVVQTKADLDGEWRVRLKSMPAGGPYSLSVKAKEEIILKDIVIGEVWLCSGQSNMEFPLHEVENAQAEIAQANYSKIRHIVVPKVIADQPKDDIGKSSWQIADPEHARDFSAVGYFFAVELYKKLRVPIGLINASWGGTNVETWTSTVTLKESSEFENLFPPGYKLKIDSIASARKASINATIQKVQGRLADSNRVRLWKDFSFNDGHWPLMQLPGIWESQALSKFDGVVWFRKEIYLNENAVGEEAVLSLSKIDDSDEVYINGVKVGGLSNQYNTTRVYQIKPGTLRVGKNVIAVRVEDTGGEGGVYGNDLFELELGNTNIKLDGPWRFQVESVSYLNLFNNPNAHPSLLFNGMISPLTQFVMKGVVWYQGEGNTDRAYQYRKAFPLLINDWRKQWAIGDFPFYFVQLSSFHANGGDSNKGSAWAELREAQQMTLSLPRTGMAVTTDIGNTIDIHPRNKRTVGTRLAAIALNKTYKKNTACLGPRYKSMRVESDHIVLSFHRKGGSLKAVSDISEISGFEISGNDRQFSKARTYIKGNKVIISSENVARPVAVRYGWADDAGLANLYNKQGFPAGPFRTDSWKGITEGAKYNISEL